MMRARVLAHRWHVAVATALVLGALSWLLRSVAVSVPGLAHTVPAPVLVAFAVVVVTLTPLYASFPELQHTLPGEPRRRSARATTSVGLALAVALPAWLAAPANLFGPTPPAAPLMLALTALGLVGLVVAGDLAWAVVLMAALGALIADSNVDQPVTRILQSVPLPVLGLAVLIGIGLYSGLGPRARA
jgi:hypothetical protein